MGKRSIILAVALTTLLAAALPAYAQATDAAQTSPFSDVSAEDWFAGAVAEGKDRGIIDGYTDGTFRPQRKLSYGEFIKMAVGGQKAEGSGTHWASGCYNYALQQGYFTERDIGRSGLDQGIPRQYMALIFANILAAEGYSEGKVASAPFSDVDLGSRYEYQISVCVKAGVLSGYKDGTFRPDAVLTRAEAASALVRFYRIMDGDALGEGSDGETSGRGETSAGNAETAAPDDPQPQASQPPAVPSDTADSSLKATLDSILQTLQFAEHSPCSLSYSKPQIPADRHFSLRISIGGGNTFYYQSDAGYRSDPSLYDPSAGNFRVDMPGVSGLSGKSISCLLSLSRTDGSAAVNYQLQRSEDGQVRLFLVWHNGDETMRAELPVPEGIFGR